MGRIRHGGNKNAHEILIVKAKGKRLLGRPKLEGG
jgi:hypothetical protein